MYGTATKSSKTEAALALLRTYLVFPTLMAFSFHKPPHTAGTGRSHGTTAVPKIYITIEITMKTVRYMRHQIER